MARTCTFSNKAKYYLILKHFNQMLLLILSFLYGYDWLSSFFPSEDARLFFAMMLFLVGFGLSIYLIFLTFKSVGFWSNFKIYFNEDEIEFFNKQQSEKFFYRQLPINEFTQSHHGEPLSIIVPGKSTIYHLDQFDDSKVLVAAIREKVPSISSKIKTGFLNWNQVFQLIVFEVLVLVILYRLDVFASQTGSELFWVILLSFGFLLGAGQPLSNIFGPKYVVAEVLLAGLLTLPFFNHFMGKVVVKYIIEAELAGLPCGKEHVLMKCYRVDQGICQQVWNASEQSCLSKHGGVNKSSPGKLVGPAVTRCRESEFDRQLHWLKTETPPECKALSQRIKDYQSNYGN